MHVLKRLAALLAAVAVLAAVSYPIYVGLSALLEPVTSATCPGAFPFFMDVLFGYRSPTMAGAIDFAACSLTVFVRLAVPTLGLAALAYRHVMHR